MIIVELGIAENSIGVHTPRKTYGYFQNIKNDKDIRAVMKLFGHSKQDVTMDYIGFDNDLLKKSAQIADELVF